MDKLKGGKTNKQIDQQIDRQTNR
jgi:hypothetical protein